MLEIPGYELVKHLGSGGMAVVYLARDRKLGRPVAIKVLLENLSFDEMTRQRFFGEARVLASLSHPNIVVLHDFIEFHDRLGLVMEYVEGRTLDHMIGKEVGPIPHEKALPIFSQVLDGVGHAHRKGVIHRDLKPGNIMVSAEGIVKVADFGIAKILGQDGLTRTGLRKPGTIYYQAPEVFKGGEAGAEADIYALGMTLYEMLAGIMPLERDTDASEWAVMMRLMKEELPDPREFYPHIPIKLVRVIQKAISKDPEKRYHTCGEMKEAISASDAAAATYDADPLPYGERKEESKSGVPSVPLISMKQQESKASRKPKRQSVPKFLLPMGGVAALMALMLLTGVFGGGDNSLSGDTAADATADQEEGFLHPVEPTLTIVDSIASGPWFRSISMVACSPGGDVAVLDGQRNEINIFNQEGEFLQGIDLSRTPAGELQTPVGIAFLSGSRLAVSDLNAEGLVVFDENYEYVETIDLFEVVAPCSIRTTADGFVGSELFMEGSNAGGYRVCRWTESGGNTVLFANATEFSRNSRSARAAVYMDMPIITASSSGMVFVALKRSLRTEVYGYDPAGNLCMRLELEGSATPRPVYLIQRDLMMAGRNYELGNTGWAPDSLLPVVSSLGVDSFDRLWVRRGTMGVPTFDVYQAAGERLFTVALDAPDLSGWSILVSDTGMLAWPSDSTERQRIYHLALYNDPQNSSPR